MERMEKQLTAVEWYNAKLNAIDFKLNSGLINYEQCKVEMSEAFNQAKEMEKNNYICSKCKCSLDGKDMQQMQDKENT